MYEEAVPTLTCILNLQIYTITALSSLWLGNKLYVLGYSGKRERSEATLFQMDVSNKRAYHQRHKSTSLTGIGHVTDGMRACHQRHKIMSLTAQGHVTNGMRARDQWHEGISPTS